MATSYELDMDEEMFQNALRLAKDIASNPLKLKNDELLRGAIASCSLFGTISNKWLLLLDDVEKAQKSNDRDRTRDALQSLMGFHIYAKNICLSSAGPNMSERIADELKEKK